MVTYGVTFYTFFFVDNNFTHFGVLIFPTKRSWKCADMSTT